MLVCTRCGFGRNQGGAAHADYWARPDGRDGDVEDRYWTEARAGVFHGALDLLGSNGAKGTILDIGGGVGLFAELALAAGWDAYSVDVSGVAVAAAAERIGPARSLPAVPAELAGRCDAVTLWCVVAHTVDPNAVLAQALGALRPGGQLFVTTPNLRFQVGYAAALAALGRPLDFTAHDHLVHFTTDALDQALDTAGVGDRRRVFVGVTEYCVANPRLSRWLVPAKRAWNRCSLVAARAGLPYLGSEIQVVGTKR